MISLKLAATILSLAAMPHAMVSKCWPRSHDAVSCNYVAPSQDIGLDVEGGVWNATVTIVREKHGHGYRVYTPSLAPEWTTVRP